MKKNCNSRDNVKDLCCLAAVCVIKTKQNSNRMYFFSVEVAGLVSDDDLSDNRSDCSEQDGQIDGTNEKRLKVKMEEESKGEISPIDENEEWAKVTKEI